MRIVIPVKWVPDTAGEKHIDPTTMTVDRTAVASVLCPVNEFAIEEAMRIKEAHGDDVETVVLIVGPEAAGPTAAKALSYGLDRAVRVTDDAIAGSDALGTAQVLAAAIRTIGFDIVLFGNQSQLIVSHTRHFSEDASGVVGVAAVQTTSATARRPVIIRILFVIIRVLLVGQARVGLGIRQINRVITFFA